MSETIYIGVANYKGGASKTLACINLAQSFVQKGMQVVIIDDDKNKTAKNWSQRRGSELLFPVLTMMEAQRYSNPRDIVIYDTPGGMTKSDIKDLQDNCSFIIVPCKPDTANLDATETIAKDLQSFDSTFRILVSDAMSAGKFARAVQMVDYLKDQKIPVFDQIIPRSAKMVDALDNGKAVGEISGSWEISNKFDKVADQILEDINYVK